MTTQNKIAKHTPGPWRIQKSFTLGEFVADTSIRSEDESYLAKIGPCNIEANANLIASAPELLAALKKSYAWLSGKDTRMESGEVADLVFEAIKKAEGEQL